MGFLKDFTAVYKLFKEQELKAKERASVIGNAPTEALVREFMRQAEEGLLVEMGFPNGATLKITRVKTGLESQIGGLRTREEF